MRLDIQDAVREGFYRTTQRNALVIVAVFVGFQVTNAIVGESMVRALFDRIDYQSVLAGFDKYRFAWIGATDNRTDGIIIVEQLCDLHVAKDWLRDSNINLGNRPSLQAVLSAVIRAR